MTTGMLSQLAQCQQFCKRCLICTTHGNNDSTPEWYEFTSSKEGQLHSQQLFHMESTNVFSFYDFLYMGLVQVSVNVIYNSELQGNRIINHILACMDFPRESELLFSAVIQQFFTGFQEKQLLCTSSQQFTRQQL